jgi:predicted secreted protein
MVQTPDNGFALAGATYSFGAGGADFWLVKIDSLGSVQWNKIYGGTANDEAHSITRTSDGGYAILGTTDSFGAGGSDFWLVKTNSSGKMLWNKTYGGSSTDDAWSIKEVPGGNLVLAGWTASFGAGSGDFWLVKTDPNGNMLWNKTYGGPLLEIANFVQQTSDGRYILFGSTYSFGAGSSDFWLVKTDAAGNEQWNKTYGGTTDDYGFSAVETLNGYALAGSTSSYGAGVYDFWLIRTDQLGNAMWNKTYGGNAYDEAWSILQTANHDFILAGWTESFGAGSSDCWLVETDELGNMQWNITWGGTNYDCAYSALQCSDENLVLTGATQSFGAGSTDFLLVKIQAVTNIAIIDVTTPKTVAGQGFSADINVTIANEGAYTETFNVTSYANATKIGTRLITLGSGGSLRTTFTWNTTGFAKGNYTISAYAWPVSGETDTSDNTFPDGTILVTLPGDINGDTYVNAKDAVLLGVAFNSKKGDPSYNPNADINNDDYCNAKDAVLLGTHFNEHW